MGLGSIYKAQKNKKNVTKGAKELQAIEKLSKSTVSEIDDYLKDTINDELKNNLIMLKAMISVDLSSRDNIAISNYLFGRLLRTQVASEYGIAKKKNQINILENSTILLESENTSKLLEKAQTILSKNIAIARNLISVTEGYAVSNKDLLPRNEKEFTLYLNEYDIYIEERINEINENLIVLKQLPTISDNTLKNDIVSLLALINHKNSLDAKEDVDQYILALFNYDLKISEMLLKLKALKNSLDNDSDTVNTLEEIIISYNKMIIMSTQNIFKVLKPFNKKCEEYLNDFNLAKKIELDYKNLISIYSKISDITL